MNTLLTPVDVLEVINAEYSLGVASACELISSPDLQRRLYEAGPRLAKG